MAIAFKGCRRRKRTATRSPAKDEHKSAVCGLGVVDWRGVIMTAIGTSERHYLPDWALGAVDVCEIDAVMAADDEWRFGRSVPVRAGTPSSPLVETCDGIVAVNVYGY